MSNKTIVNIETKSKTAVKFGRPSLYGVLILEQSLDYLNNFETKGDLIPSISGLSFVLGVTRSTVYDWAKHEDKKDFSYILERIIQKQEVILLNNGLSGKFNSSIVKLVLGKHGYNNKDDIKVSFNSSKAPSNWVIQPVRTLTELEQLEKSER